MFRDYLIASPDKVLVWSDFKRAKTAAATDLASYGPIKAPVWALLMECTNRWAEENGWSVG